MNQTSRFHSCQTSAVSAAFDALAGIYDQSWTESELGRHQRQQVWHELQGVFPPGGRLLELGCGTGIDAAYLARAGLRIHAVDASSEMLRLAKARIGRLGLSEAVSFELRAIENLAQIRDSGPFDGIYSNFGALNCVEDPYPVSRELARLLRPGGKLCLCLLGRFCLWETLWFLLHGEPRKSLRRFAGQDGLSVFPASSPPFQVYYPSISTLKGILASHFDLLGFRSIGVLVPPSYAEAWARRHRRLLSGLAAVDRHAGRLPGLRATGDHRLVLFVRRGQ
jgi:ubiquinone/menaquinone biosynthesis C-methylase UbiE